MISSYKIKEIKLQNRFKIESNRIRYETLHELILYYYFYVFSSHFFGGDYYFLFQNQQEKTELLLCGFSYLRQRFIIIIIMTYHSKNRTGRQLFFLYISSSSLFLCPTKQKTACAFLAKTNNRTRTDGAGNERNEEEGM